MIDSQDLPDHALQSRTGLPDALRVLLEEFPRSTWQAHAGFDGLIRFWLDRHMMFRQLTAKLKAETEARLDSALEPTLFRKNLSRFGSALVSELHGHHRIEDAHYFPVLSRRDHRISAGFEILDRDHHDLDGILNRFVESANAALNGQDHDLIGIGAFHKHLAHFETQLERHLVDEEDLVVPVLLKFGSSGIS